MLQTLGAVLVGVVGWTLAEYLLHRFLGHDRRTWPNPFATEHIRHHSQGDYFAPTSKKALAALAALMLLGPLSAAITDIDTGIAFSCAFVGMYVVYEILHRRAHTHAGIGAYGRFLRRHHFHHHFGNPKSNHGVTSPIWDWVAGTLEPSPRVRVPENLAMVWLINRATRDVYPRFAGSYEIVRKRSGA